MLFRLSVMMFLQYAVWGAWFPVAARYLSASTAEGGLGFSGSQIGMILGLAGSIGAVLSPFIAGQIADRAFSTERFLACLLLVGGAVKWVTASQTAYESWLWLSIAYSVVYMPTLALSNSLAFAHLTDRDRQFPRVRLWGTIGWIAASWVFPMIWLQSDLSVGAMPPFFTGAEVDGVTSRLADALRFSALISFGYGAYCLTLPNTPPDRESGQVLAFAKAFRLLKIPSFLILVLASLPISVIHQVYFLQAGPFLSSLGLGDSEIGPAMTIGQFSEILMIAGLGWMLKRMGMRTVIWLGTMAYVGRYAIWGFTELPVWVLVSSQVLHGVCYACFFATAFIYVDRIAPPDVRHSAQTVFGILILGGGPVIGGWLSGFLQDAYTLEGEFQFSLMWWTLGLIALLTGALFAMLFRDESEVAA